MKPILFLVLVFASVLAAFTAASVGLGYLLHWVFPDVDTGSGAIVGCIALAATALILVRFAQLVADAPDDEAADGG